MALVDSWKQKLVERKEAVAIFAIFTVIQLAIYTAVWNKPMTWDSSIYVAMGKNLFSLGEIGLWEVFRPPVIPVLVGTIWKLGLPIIPVSRLVHLGITVVGTGIIYRQLEKIFDYRTALYTASIILATPVFITNTTNLLTGIISAILVTLSLNTYVQEKEMASGTLSGLAFLTRFPSILIAPAIGIYQLVKGRRKPKESVYKLVMYGAPVAGLMAFYFAANHFILGNAFEPIISGASVPPSDATSLFGTFYLKNLANNPLILLSIPGVYWIIKKREEQFYPYISALGVFFLFFEAYPHKETRYALVFLPFLALTGSYAAQQIQDRFELKDVVIVGLAAIIMIIAALPIYTAASYQTPGATEFYQQFEDLHGTIAVNTPQPIQYGDFDYQALPQGYLAGTFNQGGIDYYGLSSCAWYNTEGEAGQEIDEFTENVSQYESIYNDESTNCSYTIYEVET